MVRRPTYSQPARHPELPEGKGVYWRGSTLVYRYVLDSEYTIAGVNWMSDCGRYVHYAVSKNFTLERERQEQAHENRDTVEIWTNWKGSSWDEDVFHGTFRHTGERGVRNRCEYHVLERVD